jgi:predicted  nucleic acid-binding Zn-ribbon protein
LNLAKLLYDLQEIDLDLQKKTELLKAIENELNDNYVLIKANEELDKKKQQLAQFESEQRTAEWEIDDFQHKLSPLEKKLYGGSVKNPKELMDLQQQVELLKSQIKEREDRALEIMSRVESVQDEVAGKAAEVHDLEKDLKGKKKKLSAEQSELQSELKQTEEMREKLIKKVAPAILQLYDALRNNKQGKAVAKIEQGRCTGCRIALPMSEIQRARIGEELVQCSSCGRILYLG